MCLVSLLQSSRHQARKYCCEKDELVRALVDVELFRSSVCDLMEVRLCLLEKNHVIRAHNAVCFFASLKPFSNLFGYDPSSGLTSFICLYLKCTWFSAFAATQVWHPRGSDRPGGVRKGFTSSSSVSSDVQDTGVRHGWD